MQNHEDEEAIERREATGNEERSEHLADEDDLVHGTTARIKEEVALEEFGHGYRSVWAQSILVHIIDKNYSGRLESDAACNRSRVSNRYESAYVRVAPHYPLLLCRRASLPVLRYARHEFP